MTVADIFNKLQLSQTNLINALKHLVGRVSKNEQDTTELAKEVKKLKASKLLGI